MKLINKIVAFTTAAIVSFGSLSSIMISNAEDSEEAYRTYGNYLYSLLKTDAEKGFYNNLLATCETVDNDYTNSYTVIPEVLYDGLIKVSEISELYYMFIFEHPEYFWLGTDFNSTFRNGKTYITINVLSDYQSGTARKQAKSQIYSAASSYINGALSYSNPYDRAKYLHDKLIENITYGGEIDETQTISSVFLDEVSVCAGYSRAYTFLCNAVGVNCFTVRGNGHEWNMVYVGGSWYCVDVTHDDQISQYKNFMLTYSEFSSNATNGDQTISSSSYTKYFSSFPSCTDTSKGENAYDFGDINNDGVVNSSDYTLLENYLNGKTSLNSLAKAAADTNSDFSINSDDLQSLYDYINDVIPYLPNLPYMVSTYNMSKVSLDFPYTGIIGDVNGDSEVDSKDAVYILIDYARSLTGTASSLSDVADVNGDGKIDSKDAVKVLKYYAESLVSGEIITPEEYFTENE